MKSSKTSVIEHIFLQRFDAATGTLSDDIVTLPDVAGAIRDVNEKTASTLSTGNLANFFKDFIRNQARANNNWPHSVFERGYSARQETGGSACFRFVRIAEGQTEPFPSRIVPAQHADRIRIETASMPLAARRLGRSDETWLIQVLVRLHVIETHFCLFSSTAFQQIDHLQTSVKLGRHSEIDALYLARTGELDRGWLICCEAKGLRDDILPDQLIRQVRAMFGRADARFDAIIPVAAKIVGHSLVYVVEFHPVFREGAGTIDLLTVASQALYELVPSIPGIGNTPKRSRE